MTILVLNPRLVEGPHPHRTQSRAHDVVAAELDDRHRQSLALDETKHGLEARSVRQIALADVAIDDNGAVLADAGQKGLDLQRRGVLRLVEQHEGVLP